MSGVIDEFGRKVFGTPKPKKARNIYSRPLTPAKEPKRGSGIYKTKFTLLARKAPEVMVKISGSGKNMGQVKAHLDYIGRNGEVELEDERGNTYKGADEIAELRDMWENSGYRIPADGSELKTYSPKLKGEINKRETVNIVLSMPPGTDRLSVKEAARNFAKDQFKNHQYAFAAHDDEKHPHVHLSVKAVSLEGIRLNPRKADLQEWREQFAEKLREQGVAANATRRVTRGRVLKSEKQAVIHIDKDFKEGKRKTGSYVIEGRKEQATRELAGETIVNPHVGKIAKSRASVVRDIGMAAKEFARSSDIEDKKIAVGLVGVVKSMEPVDTTKHKKVTGTMQAEKTLEPKQKPSPQKQKISEQDKEK